MSSHFSYLGGFTCCNWSFLNVFSCGFGNFASEKNWRKAGNDGGSDGERDWEERREREKKEIISIRFSIDLRKSVCYSSAGAGCAALQRRSNMSNPPCLPLSRTLADWPDGIGLSWTSFPNYRRGPAIYLQSRRRCYFLTRLEFYRKKDWMKKESLTSPPASLTTTRSPLVPVISPSWKLSFSQGTQVAFLASYGLVWSARFISKETNRYWVGSGSGPISFLGGAILACLVELTLTDERRFQNLKAAVFLHTCCGRDNTRRVMSENSPGASLYKRRPKTLGQAIPLLTFFFFSLHRDWFYILESSLEREIRNRTRHEAQNGEEMDMYTLTFESCSITGLYHLNKGSYLNPSIGSASPVRPADGLDRRAQSSISELGRFNALGRPFSIPF